MLVAQQKRKENIAEYILYLYQVEDLIRAFELNAGLLEQHVVAGYNVDEKTREEVRNWYNNLLLMMQKEGKQQAGHLQFLANLINDVNELHLKLLQTGIDPHYQFTFQDVAGLIAELKNKNRQAGNDVQVALDAVYGYLLLKIRKKKVSNETAAAMKRIGNWLAELSKQYRKYEAGELFNE